jgi:ribosomal protein L11 methylase PrmA
MTDFATLYQVILSLKDKDVINAYKILKNTSWQPYIINHTINARKSIQKREIGIISKAYSTISLTKMCAILDMNNDEIMNEIKAYNWQYDQSTNSVKITSVITDYDYQNEYDFDYQDVIPTDDSERFSLSDSWEIINNKALELQSCGYTAGNTNWVEFMESYKHHGYTMYIAWNPTHKQFAVETDCGIINQNYPHLVNASRFTEV